MMFSEKLITLLNKTLKEEQVSDELKNYHFVNVNRISTRGGWLVEPDACNLSTLAWANSLHYNPNSTFYKNWAQVKESSDFGLFLNQCLHYITTYGTDFQAEPFVINNNPIELSYKDFRVLRAVPEQEIIDDLVKLLESGIAMDAQTVNSIVDFFVERNKLNTLDLAKVKNKEAQAMIAIHTVNNGGKLPNDEFCILRALTYAIIEDTNIINSDAFIGFIRRMYGMCNDYKKTNVKNLLKSLTEDQLKSLAKIFRRYKKVFLAIRLFDPKTVNRIRRLSDKYHRPFEKGFWERVVSDTNKNNLSVAESKIDEINNFKKAQILQSILLRELKPDTGFYHIRNGKTFIRENYKPVYEQDYHTRLKYILLDSLSKSLTKKYRKEDGSLPFVVLPKNIELAFPISEKNFVGNIPAGSHVDLGSDISIGIYWENAWGTRDFDLHFSDFEGNRYGWCYGYRDSQRNIMYSGDMTNAENGASELYKIMPCLPPGDLPEPGIIPKSLTSPALAGRFFTLSTTWEAPFSMLYSPFPSAESLLEETLVPQVGDLLQGHTLPYIVKVTIYSLDTVHLTDMPALNNTSGFCRLFLGPHTLLSPFHCPHITTCV